MKAGAGKEIAKVEDKETNGYPHSTLSQDEEKGQHTFGCFWPASEAAALIQLRWCGHPMRAGAADSLMIRRPVPPAGRMGGIVRCGCNLSLAARMAY